MVPLAELLDTRKRAQGAEEEARQARLQAQQLTEAFARLTANQQPQNVQPQQQPKQIDPVIDPAGYARELELRVQSSIAALTQQVDTRLQALQLNSNEAEARKKHGNEVVDAAFEAAKESGFLASGVFINRPDPYGAMVDWYQGTQIKQQLGNTDINAIIAQAVAKGRADVLAEINAAKGGAAAPSNLPPSLADTTRASTNPVAAVQDTSDFFKQMF